MSTQLISQEDFASVQQVQAGVTRLLQKAAKQRRFYRVMRNQEPVGVLIPDSLWQEWLEDMEAASSDKYRKMIKEARESKKWYSAEEVKQSLGI